MMASNADITIYFGRLVDMNHMEPMRPSVERSVLCQYKNLIVLALFPRLNNLGRVGRTTPLSFLECRMEC